MQNNTPNNYLKEEEINLSEIFKTLFNSKKLIIAITLVITTLGAIYSLQKTPTHESTALIEIGTLNFGKKLIEPVPTLINELNIQFIHKGGDWNKQGLFNPKLQFMGLYQNELKKQNRLLEIKVKSTLPKENKELVNKILIFIQNRHLNMQSTQADKFANQMEKLIGFKPLSNEQNYLALQLQIMELEFKIQQKSIKTQLVGEIETKESGRTKVELILSSFIFGLFLSICIVFITKFFKALKKEQV
jgi:LPS O-antigen subunit length determinant protein (WzzB/FepE family)